MSEDIHIDPVFGKEDKKTRLAEIRFDCKVKMFDFGSMNHVQSIFQVSQKKERTPQWFALTTQLSLEFIETSDPELIGRAIKDAYKQLKDHIERYEKS